MKMKWKRPCRVNTRDIPPREELVELADIVGMIEKWACPGVHGVT